MIECWAPNPQRRLCPRGPAARRIGGFRTKLRFTMAAGLAMNKKRPRVLFLSMTKMESDRVRVANHRAKAREANIRAQTLWLPAELHGLLAAVTRRLGLDTASARAALAGQGRQRTTEQAEFLKRLERLVAGEEIRLGRPTNTATA